MKASFTIAQVLVLCIAVLAQSNLACTIVQAQAAKADSVKAAASVKLPAFISSEEVKIKGDESLLAGTLFLPKNKAGQKVPAILIISEFYSNRDVIPVAKGAHHTYRDLAEYFVSKGIAVLRYDRRCTGESTCSQQGTMALAAMDGVLAAEYLRGRKEIDPAKVWVFGHGDGSFIAAGIASHKEIAGLISISALGRNASKLLRDWAKMKMADQKATEAETKAYLDRLEKLILTLAETGQGETDLKGQLQDELVAPLIKNPGYAFSWLLDDPLLIFPSAVGPVLIVHGGKDRRVPAKENSYLHDTLESGNHQDFTTMVLPDLDYYLKQNKGAPSFDVDNDTARPLDPALLKVLDEWIANKINK